MFSQNRISEFQSLKLFGRTSHVRNVPHDSDKELCLKLDEVSQAIQTRAWRNSVVSLRS